MPGKGRPFQKGNKASPGRKPRKVEESYMDVMIGAVSLQDWREIVTSALSDAKAGINKNVARAWLSQYLLSDKAFAAKLYGENNAGDTEIANVFRDLINARRAVDTPRENKTPTEPLL